MCDQAALPSALRVSIAIAIQRCTLSEPCAFCSCNKRRGPRYPEFSSPMSIILADIEKTSVLPENHIGIIGIVLLDLRSSAVSLLRRCSTVH